MALSGSMVDSTQVISIHCDRIDTAMAIQFKEYMRTQTQSNAAQVMHDLSVAEFIESSGLDDIAASIKSSVRCCGWIWSICARLSEK